MLHHYHDNSSCRHGLHCIIPPYILNCVGKCLDVTAEVDVNAWLGSTRRHSSKLRGLRKSFHPEPAASTRAVTAGQGTKVRQIYDAQNKGSVALPGRLVRSEGQPAGADPAVNEAYDHSGITYDFYEKVFARNSLDDQGLPLVSSVHVGKNLNNAFWTGAQMAYGDGDGRLFTRFTRSIDVVGHELSHGVIAYTADLIYEKESGALNEHFADVFGMLTRQWYSKTDAVTSDWLVGKDIMGPAASARSLRTFKAGKAFENDPYFGTDPQPKHLRDLFKGSSDNGGVHINSGIPNHAFYLFATALKGNAWDAAGSVWYATLLQLASNANFLDMVQVSDKTVVQKYGSGSAQHKALTAAWKAVGY